MTKRLHEITIVLTLYGRNSLTKRFLKYLESSGFRGKLMIGDGAPTQYVQDLVNQSSLNIEYFKFNDQTPRDYINKLVFLAHKVQSKYLILCDNDDFPVLPSIDEGINFLNKSPDFVGWGGRDLMFMVGGGIHTFNPKLRLPISVLANTPAQRATSLISNYILPTWYHIYRVDAFKSSISTLKETEFSDYCVIEIYLAALLAAHGKISFDPKHIHYIRQANTSQVSSKMPSTVDRLVFGNLAHEYQLLLNVLTEQVSHISEESVPNIRKQIEAALRKYTHKALLANLDLYNQTFIKRLIRKVLSITPKLKYIYILVLMLFSGTSFYRLIKIIKIHNNILKLSVKNEEL